MPLEYFDNSRVELTAHVQGREDSQIIWKNNPCKCPESLSVAADPTSIKVGEGNVEILIYLESSGYGIRNRNVTVKEITDFGSLQWESKLTATSTIENEKAHVNNSVTGVSRVTVSRMPFEVESVKLIDANGNPTGSNLYSTHSGKIIDLNTVLTSQTEVVVTYSASGIVKNFFHPVSQGTARIIVTAESHSEEGLEAILSINITAADAPVDDDDDQVDDPGSDDPEIEYYLTGPSYCFTPTSFLVTDGAPYTTEPVYKQAAQWETNMDDIVIVGKHFMSKMQISKTSKRAIAYLFVRQTTPSFNFQVIAQNDDGQTITRDCVFQYQYRD